MVDIPDTNWYTRVADRPVAVVLVASGVLVATLAVTVGVAPPASLLSGGSDVPTPPTETTTVSRTVLDARTPTPVASGGVPPATPSGEKPHATRTPPPSVAYTARQTASVTPTASPTGTDPLPTTTAPTSTTTGSTLTAIVPTPTTTERFPARQTPPPSLVVVKIHADAPGADRTNLTREFVVVRNPGSRPLKVGNWTVADADGHRYRFPPTATLPANTTVRLHTGVGRDTARHRYWNRSTPVWNNGGDIVVVRDADGRERARLAYGTAAGRDGE